MTDPDSPEALLARADWLLNSTVGERIAAGVAPEDVVRDLASALRRQLDEIDMLQDDVLRFITQRNLVCDRLAARIIPGPDAQDDIDRRRLIQEVSEDAWDDVDGWQEMAAKGAMVIAERDRLKRELAEARDTRPRPDIETLAEAVHQAYLDTCERLGWPVKPDNQVPYAELAEDSKELDRASVRAVLALLSGVPTEDRS